VIKAIASILFSFFFLLTTMQQTTFLLVYKLDEKSITEKYCVNKNVKNSCCHGSCHLNKTLAKSENEDNRNPFSTLNIKIKEVEIFFNKILKAETPFSSLLLKHSSYYISHLSEGFHTSLLKPPVVLG